MLEDVWQHIGELAGLAGKNLALAIYDIFLQIIGYLLGGAEILHCVRYSNAHLLT